MRAKFRVMQVTQSHDAGTTVRLLPVNPKSSYGDGSEENKLFWEASPSGEAEVRLEDGEAFCASLRECVYIDFEPMPENTPDGWRVSEATLRSGNGQLDVRFQATKSWGTYVLLRIQQRETVRRLLPVLSDGFCRGAWLATDALALQYGGAPPEQRWQVTFSPAPG